MKFKDSKTFSAYVRSKLHSGYITLLEISSLALNKIPTKHQIMLNRDEPG